MQSTLGQAFGGLRAAVLAGVVFGLYHLNPLNVVPLIVLGVYFGFLAYRTESLSLALAAHFFNNFLACAAAYYHGGGLWRGLSGCQCLPCVDYPGR